MALMSSGDMVSGSVNAQGNQAIKMTPGPAGTGQDSANPSAGSRRGDNLQSAVYGTEYANPERWGPAMPPLVDTPNTAENEATENYRGGDRQPQMREVTIGPGGLRADTVSESMSPTDRGAVMLSRERPDVPNRTWEGQDGTPVIGSSTSGAGGGMSGGGRNFGTDLTVDIKLGGVRGSGMIPLPGHISSASPTQRGPAA